MQHFDPLLGVLAADRFLIVRKLSNTLDGSYGFMYVAQDIMENYFEVIIKLTKNELMNQKEHLILAMVNQDPS